MKALCDKANKVVTKNELLLLFVIVLIVLLKWMSIPFINMIAIIVLLSISMLYYMAVLNGKEELTKNQTSVYKLIGISSAVILTGILFSLLHWPNSQIMLIVGGLVLIGVLLVIRFFEKIEYNFLMPSMKIRFIVLFILGGFFLFGFY